MNVRMIKLPLGITLVLAAILVEPLAAQTASNSNLTSASTTGVQPVNDIVPLVVFLTGAQNWNYVGSPATRGNGTSGVGNGQLVLVTRAAQAFAAPATWGPDTFGVSAASAATPLARVTPDGATAIGPPVWPNFAPIATARPAPDPPAAAVSLPPPIWKKQGFRQSHK